ncbi:hypothetical protein, conserved [Leishmania tarentolae]|uniref:Uncharacterized protein n=1 Tax=Leishmania tarentolae TaxID=5689 RepID=A0A640KGT1_LEITA|nr:hypothetical protein, conserved [Leishmania tarentolae]
MNTHSTSAYDALARMSDEEDEEQEDLELTFVPASRRCAPASSRTVGHHAGNAALPMATSSTVSGPMVSTIKPRTETVYEQERNAKVRQLLTEQQKTTPGVVFSLDAFEALPPERHARADFQEASGTFASSSSVTYNGEDQRRGPSQYRGRGGTEGWGRGGLGGEGSPRRYRMRNPNMSEEEQARYIRHRRNMAVIRNALREVDPDTLEYMQVTQAPDQLPLLNRDREGFSKPYFGTDRGRGGVDVGRGRSWGMRGRGAGGTRGNGLGRGAGGGGGGRSAPFSPYS